jgi:hypothetical protein
MKALLFNHHPDFLYHIWTLLKTLNIDCSFATESATLQVCDRSSTKTAENKFELISKLFSPEELFPDMKNIKFTDNIENFDLYFTIHPAIAQNNILTNVVWNGVVHPELQSIFPEKALKVTSVQKYKEYKALYLPYFVPRRGKHREKKYISQLMTQFYNEHFTTLMGLKQKYPVIIAGHESAPDGIVNDWEVLAHTSLLVHEKKYGTNCNSVCKALDNGIPVYMSKNTKTLLGFDDLPDFMFLYSEDYSIEEAYRKSLNIDFRIIQSAYRQIRNIENSSIFMYNILNTLKS